MPPTIVETDPLIYTPEVSKATGEWFVSESDLDYIAEGAAILGTGKTYGLSVSVKLSVSRWRRLGLYWVSAFTGSSPVLTCEETENH